ncbi:MAG: HK97 family phage prohead protease [Mogibacterium sp.]|nr:HK97 family phage prohead protease [Mogibacterium sp.]
MKKKNITVELKANNGTIRGYAATFTREPDSYGDVIAKGAFIECLERMKAEGKVIPLLWNHDSYDLKAYIGTVFDLGEDDHGLMFEAGFDDTPEAQRARELAMDGRLCKFSFAYETLEAGEITLEDGRKANELRKLNIHEVSLVMYPANPDTSVIEVKSGRRNSKADEEELRKVTELLGSAQSIINSLLADDNESEDEKKAKSEEPDPANDEEQKRVDDLIKKANSILKKGETI